MLFCGPRTRGGFITVSRKGTDDFYPAGVFIKVSERGIFEPRMNANTHE